MSKLFLCDYDYYDIVKSLRNLTFEEILKQEKWWILITVGNIQGVYQTKYYYGSVEKSKFLFSWFADW